MGTHFGKAHKIRYCTVTKLIIRRVLQQIPGTSEKLSIVRQKNQLASCGDIVASFGYMYMDFIIPFSIVRVRGWHEASEMRYTKFSNYWQKATRSKAEC